MNLIITNTEETIVLESVKAVPEKLVPKEEISLERIGKRLGRNV